MIADTTLIISALAILCVGQAIWLVSSIAIAKWNETFCDHLKGVITSRESVINASDAEIRKLEESSRYLEQKNEGYIARIMTAEQRVCDLTNEVSKLKSEIAQREEASKGLWEVWRQP